MAPASGRNLTTSGSTSSTLSSLRPSNHSVAPAIPTLSPSDPLNNVTQSLTSTTVTMVPSSTSSSAHQRPVTLHPPALHSHPHHNNHSDVQQNVHPPQHGHHHPRASRLHRHPSCSSSTTNGSIGDSHDDEDTSDPMSKSPCCSNGCCFCCSKVCNCQIFFSYIIALTASSMVVGGIYLSVTQWDRNYLFISAFGFVLTFIGACMYYCGTQALTTKWMSSEDDMREEEYDGDVHPGISTIQGSLRSSNQHAQQQVLQLQSGSSGLHPQHFNDLSRRNQKRKGSRSGHRGGGDSMRSMSQLSLNMIPQYFSPSDTHGTGQPLSNSMSTTTTLTSSAFMKGDHSKAPFSGSQIVNLNGQSFLILPISGHHGHSSDGHHQNTSSLSRSEGVVPSSAMTTTGHQVMMSNSVKDLGGGVSTLPSFMSSKKTSVADILSKLDPTSYTILTSGHGIQDSCLQQQSTAMDMDTSPLPSKVAPPAENEYDLMPDDEGEEEDMSLISIPSSSFSSCRGPSYFKGLKRYSDIQDKKREMMMNIHSDSTASTSFSYSSEGVKPESDQSMSQSMNVHEGSTSGVITSTGAPKKSHDKRDRTPNRKSTSGSSTVITIGGIDGDHPLPKHQKGSINYHQQTSSLPHHPPPPVVSSSVSTTQPKVKKVKSGDRVTKKDVTGQQSPSVAMGHPPIVHSSTKGSSFFVMLPDSTSSDIKPKVTSGHKRKDSSSSNHSVTPAKRTSGGTSFVVQMDNPNYNPNDLKGRKGSSPGPATSSFGSRDHDNQAASSSLSRKDTFSKKRPSILPPPSNLDHIPASSSSSSNIASSMSSSSQVSSPSSSSSLSSPIIEPVRRTVGSSSDHLIDLRDAPNSRPGETSSSSSASSIPSSGTQTTPQVADSSDTDSDAVTSNSTDPVTCLMRQREVEAEHDHSRYATVDAPQVTSAAQVTSMSQPQHFYEELLFEDELLGMDESEFSPPPSYAEVVGDDTYSRPSGPSTSRK